MSNTSFMGIALMDNSPLRDGRLGGVPVLQTTAAATTDNDSPGGGRLFLIDAAEILLADDGKELEVSEETSVQMDSSPDDPTTAATVMVSLWQHNLVGIRVNRYIRWERRTPGAAGFISRASYGA
jgi:hypothetical protein